MVDSFALTNNYSVDAQIQRSKRAWWLLFLGMGAVTGLINLLLLRTGGLAGLVVIAWLIYLSGAVAIFYQPRYGVYLIFGLTLVSDRLLMSWYPFTKNFSSGESLMYLSNALIISPLETYIVLTFLVWLGRMAIQRKWFFRPGLLTWPALIFIAFITFGLVYGLGRGGNLVIALWEARAIYYLPAMLVLGTNLIETRQQVNRILWIAVIAMFIKSIFGFLYIALFLKFDIGSVERIAEHSMSIHFNTFFVMAIAAWLFRDSFSKRLVLPLMSPLIFYTFIANHRRAGFLTLGVALILILLVLYRYKPRIFWRIAPIMVVASMAYLAIFWNSEGSLGMPARAVRSVFGQADARDQASNIYRDIENYDIMFTIKQTPLTGVGFGQKFYIVVPLPDISFFEWWEYITHNSIMWIWMKSGVGGFISLVFMVGMTITVGSRSIWEVKHPTLRVAGLTATLYIIMHFIYAYVDMSWDLTSMTYIGMMMAVINNLTMIGQRPEAITPKRWPWQADSLAPTRPRWPWLPVKQI